MNHGALARAIRAGWFWLRRPQTNFLEPALSRSRPIFGLILLLGASTAGSSVPVIAQATAGATDSADSPNCIDYYFGIGIPQSFEKAFACFQTSDDGAPSYIWLILMTLNGQGTPQSLPVARELLVKARLRGHDADASILEDACCITGGLDAAAEIIQAREKDPKRMQERLSICNFGAGQNDQDICENDLEDVMTEKDNAELRLIEAKVSTPARTWLDQINATFQQFKNADGAWKYDQYVEGSGRSSLATSQATLDQSNFVALIRRIVRDHGLKARSEQDFRDQDKDLNSAYRKRIEEVVGGWDERLKDPTCEDCHDLPQYKADFLESGKKVQRLWIKLEEPWKRLCEELYRGEMPPAEIDRGVETELREIRIREIKGEP